jgi:hypothetical protein
MWKYLELLDRTAPLIEDIYLCILDALDLERPNPYSIFKSIQWQGFRNVILKDRTIREVMAQIEKWKDSGHAVNNPS